MIGVADPDGTIRFGELTEETEPLINGKTVTISGLMLLGIMLLLIARIDPPQNLNDDTIVTFDAMLVDNN
jgi:hypothetical protein